MIALTNLFAGFFAKNTSHQSGVVELAHKILKLVVPVPKTRKSL